jgi:WD40 repeat protein
VISFRRLATASAALACLLAGSGAGSAAVVMPRDASGAVASPRPLSTATGALLGLPPGWAAPGTCATGPVRLSGPKALDAGGHTDVRTVDVGRLDGRPVAVSAGAEGTVRFWTLPALRPAAPPLKGTAARFVPLGGTPGVLVEGDGGARLWDLPARRVVMRFPERTVFALGEHRGAPALFAARNGAVRVYDPATRAVLRTVRTTGASAIAAGRLAGRDVLVAYEGEESPLRIWDVTSGRTVGRELHLNDEYATADWMAITEISGRTILLVRSYLGVHRWDLATQQDLGMLVPTQDMDPDQAYSASALIPGPGRPMLALGRHTGDPGSPTNSVPATTELFDPASGRVLGVLTGHQGTVTALAVGTLDGRPVLLSGGADNTVRLWDAGTRRQIGDPTPAGPRDGAEAAALAADGDRLLVITGEEDGTVRSWDAATLGPTGRPMTSAADPGGGLYALAVADLEGVPVAVASYWPPRLVMWNLRTSAPLGVLPLPSLPPDAGLGQPVAVRGTGGPALVAVGGKESGLVAYTWDLRTRRPVAALDLNPRRERAHNRALLAQVDGRAYAVVYDGRAGPRRAGREVRVWDIAAGRPAAAFVLPPSPAEEFEIRYLGRFGCGVALLVSDGGAGVKVLDPATGRRRGPEIRLTGAAGHSAWLVGVADVDGHALAMVETGIDDERSRRLWDLTARAPLSPDLARVHGAAFAAGPSDVAGAGPAGQVLVWRLSR